MFVLLGSILGIVLGFVALFIPVFFWPDTASRLSRKEFSSQYPNKKWVTYVYFGLPIIWLILYVLLFQLIWNISDENLYFVTFSIVGGIAFWHGILEILTKVSMKNFYRLGPETYVVDEFIRRLGVSRIGLVLLLGIFPSLIFAI